MMAGLFYPCALLGSFNYNLHNVGVVTDLRNQDFILAEMVMPVVNEKEIVSNLKNEVVDVQAIGVSATLIRIPAFFEDKSELVYLQGLDNVVMNMTDWTLNGRIPTETELEEESPVALVTVAFMQKYNLKLGDTISVYGKDLQIIGSVMNGDLKGNVLIPYKVLKKVSINNDVQYQLFVFGSQLEKNDVKNAIEKYYPASQIIDVRNSKEIANDVKSGFITVMGIDAVHSLITLMLSIASTVIIVSGRLINSRKNIAIKLAHGASIKSIIADGIIETFIFSVVSLAIDLILIYLLRGVLSNVVTVMFSWYLILYCLMFAGVFSLAVGLISGIITTHFDVSDMLRV